jgi:hypothetical protein
MTEDLSGRRIVVPDTRELGQLLRMLEERGADAVPRPMVAIRDTPDTAPSGH